MSFKELCNKMKKGEAPNVILYKGIVFKYQGRYATKEERLADIKNNGLWNNGGYVSDDCEFLLDYLVENDFTRAEILELPDILEKDDKDIPLIPDDELYYFETNKSISKGTARDLDYNFKVLKEKINQVVEVINNEYNK